MSTIPSTNSSNSTTATGSSTSTAAASSLDFNDFINLLATELKYQDPDNPVSGTEYISQMAQLSTLSGISSMNSSLSNVAAYSMIGKEATYSFTDSSGTTRTGSGIVQSVTNSAGTTTVNVGGTSVDYSSIVTVSDAADTATT
jgi:flagellar basal-body rod modification protein FlgD